MKTTTMLVGLSVGLGGCYVADYGFIGHDAYFYGYETPVITPALRGAYPYHQRPATDAGFYGTLGGIMYDVDGETFGAQGRLGYNINTFMGLEAEGSLGLNDETIASGTVAGGDLPVEVTNAFPGATAFNVDVDAGVDYQFAVLGRLRVPMTDNISGFARAGYHHTRVSADVSGQVVTPGGTETVSANTDGDANGFVYGAGVEMALNPRNALRLDYTRYELGNNSAATSDSVAASYVFKF